MGLMKKFNELDLMNVANEYGYGVDSINDDRVFIWDKRTGTKEDHHIEVLFEYDCETVEGFIDILKYGKNDKKYVPCYARGTKAEQLYKVLNEGDANPFVPWDVDVDDNGDVVVVVPISDITLKKTLSLQDMYRAVRDQLVSNAEYIIENMKNTEPADREEWDRLCEE